MALLGLGPSTASSASAAPAAAAAAPATAAVPPGLPASALAVSADAPPPGLGGDASPPGLRRNIRVGVRFTYGGVFMPAYLAFIGRHSAFVQFLKRWNPKPPEVEETNPLAFMDAFLCDAERGVRTIRDIHPPERGSGR